MIQYSDHRGRSLDTYPRHELELVKDFKPNFVVLQLGCNNLCNSQRSVSGFTNEYHSIINDLINSCNVQRIVVLHILHRLEPSRPVQYYVDAKWLNPWADNVNTTL